MSKPRKDEPLKMPYYRGGDEAMGKFLTDNLKYPEEALELKIEGDVEATFDVDGLGRTQKPKIVKGLGHGCDEEVIRLIGLLKFEKAYNKGRNVTLHKNLTVNFKLPKKKKPMNQTVNYQVVKSKPKPIEKEPQKEAPKKITYTINLNA